MFDDFRQSDYTSELIIDKPTCLKKIYNRYYLTTFQTEGNLIFFANKLCKRCNLEFTWYSKSPFPKR